MKSHSYKKRGGDIASSVGLGDNEDKKSIMDTISGHASDLKNKITGLFSGGGKSKKRFNTKKRTLKNRKTNKKRKTNKRKSAKRK